MSTIYGDLRPQIERNFGNRMDTGSQASILFYFNAAQKILANVYPWRELEKKVCPTLEINISDYAIELERFHSFYSVFLLTSTSGIPLLRYSPLKWDKEIAPLIPTSSKSKPSVYTYWGNTLSLFRKPDAAYTLIIRFYQWPLPITNDSTVLQIQNVDEVLVSLTTGLCWYSIEEAQIGSVWIRQAVDFLKIYAREDISLKGLDTLGKLDKTQVSTDYWLNPFIKSTP